jgi:hypothetical protein
MPAGTAMIGAAVTPNAVPLTTLAPAPVMAAADAVAVRAPINPLTARVKAGVGTEVRNTLPNERSMRSTCIVRPHESRYFTASSKRLKVPVSEANDTFWR